MKILFLDIDGVLNREGTRELCGPYTGVDRGLSKLLLDFLPQDVQIVLSSTWRNHPEMHEHLKEAGLTWIDKTPRLHAERGFEIKDWLERHPEATHYVILDDSSDMLPEQYPRFVHTNYIHGVTLADMEKMVAIFET